MIIKIEIEGGAGDNMCVSLEELKEMTQPLKQCTVYDEKNNRVIKAMKNVSPGLICAKLM